MDALTKKLAAQRAESSKQITFDHKKMPDSHSFFNKDYRKPDTKEQALMRDAQIHNLLRKQGSQQEHKDSKEFQPKQAAEAIMKKYLTDVGGGAVGQINVVSSSNSELKKYVSMPAYQKHLEQSPKQPPMLGSYDYFLHKGNEGKLTTPHKHSAKVDELETQNGLLKKLLEKLQSKQSKQMDQEMYRKIKGEIFVGHPLGTASPYSSKEFVSSSQNSATMNGMGQGISSLKLAYEAAKKENEFLDRYYQELSKIYGKLSDHFKLHPETEGETIEQLVKSVEEAVGLLSSPSLPGSQLTGPFEKEAKSSSLAVAPLSLQVQDEPNQKQASLVSSDPTALSKPTGQLQKQYQNITSPPKQKQEGNLKMYKNS